MAFTQEPTTMRNEALASFPAAEARLDALTKLAPDWDTHGAQPIALRAITAARELLRAVAAHPRTAHAEPSFVAPVPYGGVQLEWRKGGQEIEVEAAPDGSLAYLSIDGAGCCRAYGETDTGNVDEVLRRIEELHAG